MLLARRRPFRPAAALPPHKAGQVCVETLRSTEAAGQLGGSESWASRLQMGGLDRDARSFLTAYWPCSDTPIESSAWPVRRTRPPSVFQTDISDAVSAKTPVLTLAPGLRRNSHKGNTHHRPAPAACWIRCGARASATQWIAVGNVYCARRDRHPLELMSFAHDPQAAFFACPLSPAVAFAFGIPCLLLKHHFRLKLVRDTNCRWLKSIHIPCLVAAIIVRPSGRWCSDVRLGGVLPQHQGRCPHTAHISRRCRVSVHLGPPPPLHRRGMSALHDGLSYVLLVVDRHLASAARRRCPRRSARTCSTPESGTRPRRCRP